MSQQSLAKFLLSHGSCCRQKGAAVDDNHKSVHIIGKLTYLYNDIPAPNPRGIPAIHKGNPSLASFEKIFYSDTPKEKFLKDIVNNTVQSRDHLTPEIVLRLITPECKLFSEPYSNEVKIFPNDPFWGFYWPGGQAVSRYLLDHPEIVKSKKVLDVGSGSGACSIAAKKCGATYAIANDIDEVACVAADVNAELNNVKILTTCENLIGANREEDVILIGDLFYDREIADCVIPWLHKLRSRGKHVLIGDPGRHALSAEALAVMQKLAIFDLPPNACIENHGFKHVHVWRML